MYTVQYNVRVCAGQGRYSVKCQVEGDEQNTVVNDGFITAR